MQDTTSSIILTLSLNPMPDLGHLSLPSSLTLTRCPTIKPPLAITDSLESAAESLHPDSAKTLVNQDSSWDQQKADAACNGNGIALKRSRSGSLKPANGSTLDDYVTAWKKNKMEAGVSPLRCFLPFLVSAKKLVECLACNKFIYPGEEVLCSVRGCRGVYHSVCAQEKLRTRNLEKFKCPQHACYLCKQKPNWRCVRCTMASHDKCAAWPDAVVHFKNQPGKAICWKHPTDWLPDMEAG